MALLLECVDGLDRSALPGFAFGYAVALFIRNSVSNEKWWTRTRRIRTAALIPIEVPIVEVKATPVYQRIAHRARHLQELGMSQAEIGRRLGVDRWTVGKALCWLRGVGRDE